MASRKTLRKSIACLVLAALGTLAGCQSERAGLTLPSPFYLRDDVQYFAPGPDFKLANEAAALQQSAMGAPRPAP